MKSFCFATALVLLTAGCSSTSPSADYQSARPGPADNDTYILHSPSGVPLGNATSRPPRLTVGTSYPNTQLILPWFLNDLIDLVNYR